MSKRSVPSEDAAADEKEGETSKAVIAIRSHENGFIVYRLVLCGKFPKDMQDSNMERYPNPARHTGEKTKPKFETGRFHYWLPAVQVTR
jgi:hypothetical protein